MAIISMNPQRFAEVSKLLPILIGCCVLLICVLLISAGTMLSKQQIEIGRLNEIIVLQEQILEKYEKQVKHYDNLVRELSPETHSAIDQ